MAKTRKRVLALLMTLVMVLGLLPTVAMAGYGGQGGGSGDIQDYTDKVYVYVKALPDQVVSGAEANVNGYFTVGYIPAKYLSGLNNVAYDHYWEGGRMTVKALPEIKAGTFDSSAWKGTPNSQYNQFASQIKNAIDSGYLVRYERNSWIDLDEVEFFTLHTQSGAADYVTLSPDVMNTWHLDGYIKQQELYTVTYHSNLPDQTDQTYTPSGEYMEGQNITKLTYQQTGLPTREGYTFIGWGTTADATEPTTDWTMGASNRHYYAIWKADTYTVRFAWTSDSAQPSGVTLPEAITSTSAESLENADYYGYYAPTPADAVQAANVEYWYIDASHTTKLTLPMNAEELAVNNVITLYAYCVPKADLAITKTFVGGDMSGVPADFNATFVVTDDNGTEQGSFIYSQVAAGNATIEDLPYGTYYVEEKDLSFTNTDGLYNETPVVTFQVNSQAASAVSGNAQKVQVTLSGDTTVAVNNAYQLADKPYVTIDKTATASATVGNEITYTITVSNIGGAAATNVVVTDRLPTDGLNLANVSVSDTAAAKVENGVLTWNVGTLAAKNGTATLIVSGAVVTEEALNIVSGKIVNTASAHHDALYADGTQDPSDSAETRITRSNLQITKTAATESDLTGATALQNETITYTITVKNSGDAAATVTVVDTLPTDYLQDFTATGSPAGTISGDGKKMTWSNVTIPAQSGDQPGKVELTFTATVKTLSDPTEGVSIVNTVAVQGKPELTASCTTYVAPTEGTLAIYKNLQGSELTAAELLRLNPGITFTVYDAENTPVGTFTLKEVLDSEASLALDPGTYTVYENDADVTGYDLVTTVSGNEVGSEGVAVTVSASGTPATVTFKNVYTSKMYQIVFHDEDVATLSLSGREATAFQWWNAGAEARWANGGYTAADGTLAFLFGNGNKDSVKNTAVVVTEDPGYAFSGKWYTADGKHSFESFEDIVNALDT